MAHDEVIELREKLSRALDLIDRQNEQLESRAPDVRPVNDVAYSSNRAPQIQKFRGKRGEDAIRFVRKYERESVAFKWDAETKKAKFASYLEDDAEQWFTVFVEEANVEDKPTDWDSLKSMFLSHFLCGNYKNFLMRQITERKWRDDETLPAYVTAKIALCKDFQAQMDDAAVIEHIYSGLDDHVKAQFLMHDPSDLQKVMEIAKRLERSLEKDRKLFGSNSVEIPKEKDKKKDSEFDRRKTCAVELKRDAAPSDGDSDALEKRLESLVAFSMQKHGFQRKQDDQKLRRDQNVNSEKRGNLQHQGYRGRGGFNRNFSGNRYQRQGDIDQHQRQGNLSGMQCYNCHNFGHRAAECKAPKFEWTKNEKGEMQGRVVSQIVAKEDRNLTFIRCQVAGKELTAMVDSGSEATIMSIKTANILGVKREPYEGVLSVADGHDMKCYGKTQIPITILLSDATTLTHDTRVIIVENAPADVLLGNDFNSGMNFTLKPAEKKVECKGKLVVACIVRNKVEKQTQECAAVKEEERDESNKEGQDKGLTVTLSEKITLSPLTETFVQVNVVGQTKGLFLLEGSKALAADGLLVQNTLCDVKGEKEEEMFLSVANITQQSVSLAPGTQIAGGEAVDGMKVAVLSDDDNGKEIKDPEPDAAAQTEKKNEKHSVSEKKSFGDGIYYREVQVKGTAVKIGADLTTDEERALINILEERNLFVRNGEERIGLVKNYTHRIEIEDTKPIYASPGRASFEDMRLIDQEMEKMERKGIVREVRDGQPISWSSRVVLVRKKDGSARIAINYFNLNKHSKKDVNPVPDIEMCFNALSGSSYFSSLDANDSFFQIKLHDDDQEKTTAVTPSGRLFVFERMPQGHLSSTASFCRALHGILGNLRWRECASYCDDLLIYGNSMQQHNERLKRVLSVLETAGFTLRLSKCTFALRKCVFLGVVVGEKGLHPSEHHTQAITQYPVPQNVTDVRSFLGLTGFFRKFIRSYAMTARPLFELTKEGKPFEWTKETQEAFDSLKFLLVNKPVLAFFDPKLETFLYTDASLKGIGSCLMQKRENGLQPVAYFSRTLKKSEKNKSIYELEVRAVSDSLQRFRHLLSGIKFTVICDNAAVTSIRKREDLRGAIARAVITMSDFDFVFQHAPGASNRVADCLSRAVRDENLLISNLCEKSDWREEQVQDPQLVRIISILNREGGSVTQREKEWVEKNFTIHRQQLYLMRREKMLLMIPSHRETEMIHAYHSLPSSGHQGVNRTLYSLQQRVYFEHMSRKVRDFVRCCKECQYRKTERQLPYGLLRPIKTEGVFETLAIDFIEDLNRSKEGYRHIVVATCSFSKLAIAKALRRCNAKETANFLFHDVFMKYGCPIRLLSDRARVFLGKVIRRLNELMQVKQVFTSGFHPQTNGITERFNSTLCDALSSFVNEKQNNWPEYLSACVFSYNNSFQDTMRCSPHEVLFGRTLRYPQDIILSLPSQGLEDPKEHSEHLKTILAETHKRIAELIVRRQRREKERYDRRHREAQLKEGDLVLVYDPVLLPGVSNKLRKKFYGPFRLKNQASDVLWELEWQTKGNKSTFVHVSRLKRFHQRDKSYDSVYRNPAPGDTEEGEEAQRTDQDKSGEETKETLDEEQEGGTLCDELETESETSDSSDSECSDSEREHKRYSERLREKRQRNKVVLMDQPVEEQLNYDYSDAETEMSSRPASSHQHLQQQDIRRSNRSHRPPNRYGMNFLSLTILSLCMISASHAFPAVDPVIWESTNQLVVEGVEMVTTAIKYESPCGTLSSVMRDYDTRDELANWCEQLYQESFLDHINSFCASTGSKDSFNFSVLQNEEKGRKKRFIFTTSLFVLTLFTVIVSIGFYAKAIRESSENSERIEDLTHANAMAERHLKILTANEKLSDKVQKNMESMLKTLSQDLVMLSRNITDMKNRTPLMMRAISMLTQTMGRTKQVMKETARMWKKNRMNMEFLEQMNISIPCNTTSCPYEHWKVKGCHHDEVRQMLVMKFEMKRIRESMQVLRSDPFDLVTVHDSKKGKRVCHSEMIGPPAVILDTTNDCVITLKSAALEGTNIILVPDELMCKKRNQKRISFKTKLCEEKESVDPSDLIQVKQATDAVYVYCSSLNITVFGTTTECPSTVFQIPSNQTFTIDRLTYEARNMKVHSELLFLPDLSVKINHKVDNSMKTRAYSEYLTQIDHEMKEKEKNEQEMMNETLNIDYHQVHGVSFAVISILFAIAIGIICMKLQTQMRRMGTTAMNRSMIFLTRGRERENRNRRPNDGCTGLSTIRETDDDDELTDLNQRFDRRVK